MKLIYAAVFWRFFFLTNFNLEKFKCKLSGILNLRLENKKKYGKIQNVYLRAVRQIATQKTYTSWEFENKPQLKSKTYKYAWLCNLEKYSMEDWRMKRHTIYAKRSWRTMTNRKFTFGICLNMAEVFKEKSVVIAVIPRFHSMNMWMFSNWMFIHRDTYFGFIIQGKRVNTARF